MHRVIKLKAQYKEELNSKRKLVRENEEAHLQLEKEQFFGTAGSSNKAERKKFKQEKKNKKLKYSLLAKRREAGEEAEPEEEEGDEESRKR